MKKDPCPEDRQLAAPKEIVDLVKRFESNLESYKSGHYNETQVRREFVDPFFKALGWDTDNEQGFAEAYKDVIHEDAVKVGTTTKAPDYSFRIGGQPKFFLEAKKPSVDIKDDIHPAFQLRRYAWTMKLPLSVLTDFEEFAVYDCSVKPDKLDKASNARIFYLNYKDYLTRWDEIADIFSKNAVMKGSFDRFAADKKCKRGTSAVDVVFLEEIAGWREILARNIALRNTELSTKDLNYAVQAIVDRIVFLRICEDRGIDRSMRLQDLLNGERVYTRLCEFFRRADEQYNSGILHFEKEPGRESPDTLTLSINIDDKPLKEIIKRLYYPDSPYEFSVLPAEILGQVYEQFLGKMIRLTEGHHAVVEDKPEVKKAGGVKYTPAYIVEYIVRNTLGPTLKGKTPQEVVPISVLDPACGSGSFLIVAYQYLMDLHRDWYTQNLAPLLQNGLMPSSPEIRRMLPVVETGKKDQKKDIDLPIFQGRGGEWRLTTAERKRILLNNIYGLDIDRQAVEVTKLSLLLKVLEGENDETISKQLKLFQERALPDLSSNIKCGNSLIGWDIIEVNPGRGQEEIDRINPFDWETEFPEIFQRGGFSAVIGNPPWGATFGDSEKDYLRKSFAEVHIRTPESFNYFVYKMWELTGRHGDAGAIIPSSFLNQHEFYKTRKLLVESSFIHRICNLGDGIFSKVTAPCCIIVLSSEKADDPSLYFDFRKVDRNSLPTYLSQEEGGKDASQIGLDSESYSLQIHIDPRIIKKCYAWPTLKDIAEDVATGISSGLDVAFIYGEGDIKKLALENELLRKIATGSEVNRYSLDPKSGKKIIYTTRKISIDDFPNCCKALHVYRDRLVKRVETAEGLIPWFVLYRPRRKKLFDEPKILIRQTSEMIRATYDAERWYCLKSVIIVQLKKESQIKYGYILGLFNSTLFKFLYDDLVGEQARTFPEVKPVQLFRLPIRTIDFAVEKDAAHHNRMVSLVDSMLSLSKQLHEARKPHEQTALQRQIGTIDRQIDALVYELYELTEEEIRIVEGDLNLP